MFGYGVTPVCLPLPTPVQADDKWATRGVWATMDAGIMNEPEESKPKPGDKPKVAVAYGGFGMAMNVGRSMFAEDPSPVPAGMPAVINI